MQSREGVQLLLYTLSLFLAHDSHSDQSLFSRAVHDTSRTLEKVLTLGKEGAFLLFIQTSNLFFNLSSHRCYADTKSEAFSLDCTGGGQGMQYTLKGGRALILWS